MFKILTCTVPKKLIHSHSPKVKKLKKCVDIKIKKDCYKKDCYKPKYDGHNGGDVFA